MWDPQTYLTYADERTRPARDLLAAVDLADPERVVDLGCGTGTSTRLLAARWPGADVLGTDSSSEMIEAARAEQDGIRYEVVGAAEWQPEGPVDLWFSNAMLQWLPGHLDLLPRWLGTLSRTGRLAFQVPANFDAPHHVLLREFCAAPAWRDRLHGISERHEAIHTPVGYADALAAAGARPDVWETTYLHRLEGPDPVLTWTMGTALRPVLNKLDGAEREAFLAEYGEAVRAAYPVGRDGVTTFPFRRIFAVGAPA
ncbi:methyltransferase domain-containing protein [Sporichthya sp.]|uniref:methyltransferase domain-containing protein n=1 Tax=Sporichthya sp. TaxID=65475 RepID=UPI0017E86B39|nr:methyltransferase domain-containing protein [Sporichthya sp.]MBA3745338.1 methyltransferase domain-containing protein [Sporichthya sp.]